MRKIKDTEIETKPIKRQWWEDTEQGKSQDNTQIRKVNLNNGEKQDTIDKRIKLP